MLFNGFHKRLPQATDDANEPFCLQTLVQPGIRRSIGNFSCQAQSGPCVHHRLHESLHGRLAVGFQHQVHVPQRGSHLHSLLHCCPHMFQALRLNRHTLHKVCLLIDHNNMHCPRMFRLSLQRFGSIEHEIKVHHTSLFGNARTMIIFSTSRSNTGTAPGLPWAMGNLMQSHSCIVWTFTGSFNFRLTTHGIHNSL